MRPRRGWTLRCGPLGVYRVIRPSRRVRVGYGPHSVSFGWLIVRRL